MIRDTFLKNSILLFFVTMSGNVFRYVYQLTMGRMLSVQDYGEMNALMSLFILFGIPFMTLVNFFANKSSVYFINQNYSAITTLQRKGLFKVCLAISPIIGIMICFLPFLSKYLNVGSVNIILVFFSIYITGGVMVNTEKN